MTDETTGQAESGSPTIGTQSVQSESRGPSNREALMAAFEAAEANEPAAPEGTPASASDTSSVASDDTAPPEPAKAIERPQHWSEKDWADLMAQPEAAREFVLKKEKDLQAGFTRKTEEVAQQRKRFEAFDRTLGDLRGKYAPQVDAARFESAVTEKLPELMGYYVNLQRDPVNTLTRLAEAYGVADKLTEHLTGLDMDGPARDLRQKQAALEAEAERLRNETSSRARQDVEAKINAFKDAKSADGTPLHPYFSDVEGEMALIVQANPGLSLEEAYDRAVKYSKFDELAEKAAQEKAAKLLAEKEAERKRQVKDARRAPIPSAGRSSGGGAKEVPLNRREALRAVWDELDAR